jgi:hypothetical protein
VLLFGDAVGCAVAGQQVPNGYYHLDRMITSVARHGAEIGLCGTLEGPESVSLRAFCAFRKRRRLPTSSAGSIGRGAVTWWFVLVIR